ncbi:hypothetical protein [Deinococcus ruber]|uniref:Uncharacterized protein n=1 Tax=Deinococcus ruber TaxID=1848197 RepID=A0A918F8U9_9DEIO|nr:hypothetical protein [Deinococcus ruber]GGR16603.1 hypothetical protein GCM10008957_31560 [Deinococcus ruber]
MTPFWAFALATVLMYLLYHPVRGEARRWRVTQTMRAGEWWFFFPLSEASGVGSGHLHVTLDALEDMGIVEAEFVGEPPFVRCHYRLKPPP